MEARELVKRRKDRAIATILGFKDEYCNEYLPDGVSEDLREVILDQVNDLYTIMIDTLHSVENSIVSNDLYWDRLDQAIAKASANGKL